MIVTIADKKIYIRLREKTKNEWHNEFTIRNFKPDGMTEFEKIMRD